MLFFEHCTESEKQNGCLFRRVVSVFVVYPHAPCNLRGAEACRHCPASPEGIALHITSLGKDKNSRFLLNVYALAPSVFKLKYPNVNHGKLGTRLLGLNLAVESKAL